MVGDRSNNFRKDNASLCNFLLCAYISFLGLMYYCIYISSNAAVSAFIHTSDPEQFLNLLKFSNIEKFTDITFKNIIYSGLLFFTKDAFFSYMWTSFVLYGVCIVLVYKLSNLYKNNNYYGLIGVFIYSTFFDMLLAVFGINVHIAETMFLLLIFYFYEKSNTFSNKKYSIAYLLAMLFAFFERESILIYLSVFLLFTFYMIIKKKNYFMLVSNILIVVIISFMLFQGDGSIYLVNKLGHWYIYLNDMDFYTQLKLPYLIIDALIRQVLKAIPLFYQILFVCCVLIKILFRSTRKITYFLLLDMFILFILGLYCLTIVPYSTEILGGIFEGEGAIIDDVLPLFAFISIGFVNFIYIYRKYKIKIIFFVLVVFIFAPSFILKSSLISLKNHPGIDKINKDRSYELFFDFAETFKFFMDKKQYYSYLFTLETKDNQLKTKLSVVEDSYTKALSDFYDKMERVYHTVDIGTHFMAIVGDIILLNGFKRVYVPDESLDVYVSNFGLDKNKVYKMLVAGYSTSDEHIFKSVHLDKLTSWGIQIDGQLLTINLYGIKEHEIK